MKKKSKLTEAILETATDMTDAGIISKKEHEKITKRHYKEKPPAIDKKKYNGKINWETTRERYDRLMCFCIEKNITIDEALDLIVDSYLRQIEFEKSKDYVYKEYAELFRNLSNR